MFFFNKSVLKDIEISPNSIEYGYKAILEDRLDDAKAAFEANDSPRGNWGCFLINVIKGYIPYNPSYMQINNFLEIDLDFLIKNEKIEYVEYILGSLDYLLLSNQLTYKYVARVMLENRLYKVAKDYLDKSKDMFYNDPELHFLYAKYYIKMRDYEKADYYLDECLNILPDYFPAKKYQKEISRYLA